jgi:uncharacterized protein
LNFHVIQKRLLKIVLTVVSYPRTTLLVCGIVLAGCVILALTRLQSSADEDKLFSPAVPFFKAFLDFEEKFPENEALYVLLEPSNPAAPPVLGRWTRLADKITDRLNLLHPYVKHARARTASSELGPYELLFADSDSLPQYLQDARTDLLPMVRLWAVQTPSPPMRRLMTALMLREADESTGRVVKALAESWSATVRGDGPPTIPDLEQIDAEDPGDLGYEYVTDQTDPNNHLLLIEVFLKDDDSPDAVAKQVDAVRQATAETAGSFPDFHVAVTGRPALDADEMRTTDIDSTRAEVVALAVIFIGLALTLRSIWLATAAEISLAVAIGWTFGWATVSVGQLNLLSMVFLITLIGIGMDYLVQILTRYRREARRYERPTAVWARVFQHVSAPICTACLGAAGAFLVSIFTTFRGAAELGIIAGGGLLLCLASGYTILPALLTLFPPKLSRIDPEDRYNAPPPRRSVPRRLISPAVFVLALAVVLPFARRTYFNPNLLDMQAKNLESVALVRKLQTWSSVAISPDLNKLRQVREAVTTSPYVARTSSILSAYDNLDWLKKHQSEFPKIERVKPADVTVADLASMAATARILAVRFGGDTGEALRKFADSLPAGSVTAARELTLWQKQFGDELRNLLGQFTPPPLDVAKLPGDLRGHLVSADGQYALYIEPRENLWQRGPLEQFVTDVQRRVDQQVPDGPAITGIAPDIYFTTQSIETAFYKATTYALVLVFVLVLLDLRNLGQTLLTVSVLALGLPMLVGLMGLLGINWNFANFFGVPILIGAGHEYGVFLMHRYREARSDSRRVWTRWDVSDRALLLCAYVTTSSFGFFWFLGHHEGLKSLGLVMALGTACIYLAALLVVRPLLKWRIERASQLINSAGHSTDKSLTMNVV